MINNEQNRKLPIHWIDPTTKCNLNCVLCPHTKLNNEDCNDMSLSDYSNVINDAAKEGGVIYLWGYGEPFLNKNILKMIEISAKLGFWIKTSSNGLLFNETINHSLCQSPLHHLVFSVDGFSQEIYEKYRQGGSFETLKNNITKFMDYKKSNNFKFPIVEIQCVVNSYNEHQLDDIESWAHEIGADIFSFKTLSLFSNSIEETEGWLPQASNHSRFKKLSDGTYESKRETKCPFGERNGVVRNNGKLAVCCMEVDGLLSGINVYEKGYINSVSSNDFKKLKKQAEQRSFDICKNCDHGVQIINRNFINKEAQDLIK